MVNMPASYEKQLNRIKWFKCNIIMDSLKI